MRHLIIALLILVVGFVLNLTVAWSCAFYMDGGRSLIGSGVRGITASQQPRWRILMGRRAGATVIRSDTSDIPPPPVPLPTDATPDETRAWLNAGGAALGPPEVVAVPGWSRAATPPHESNYEERAVWEDARGWPMVCLLSYSADFGGRVKFPWALDLGGTQGPMGLPRVLPLRPILSGFAINTLVYAVALWSIILGPTTLRRTIRRRRHRCPACGYPIGESDLCSECGGALSG
ncbi:MAG: hypothetical protein ACYSU7_05890 [Planctomycetota bacterium]|jgi:hypothetical protein